MGASFGSARRTSIIETTRLKDTNEETGHYRFLSEPASDPSTSDAPGDSATVMSGRDPQRSKSCGLSRDGAARAARWFSSARWFATRMMRSTWVGDRGDLACAGCIDKIATKAATPKINAPTATPSGVEPFVSFTYTAVLENLYSNWDLNVVS